MPPYSTQNRQPVAALRGDVAYLAQRSVRSGALALAGGYTLRVRV